MTIECEWCRRALGEKCPGCGEPAARLWPLPLFVCRRALASWWALTRLIWETKHPRRCWTRILFRRGAGGHAGSICDACGERLVAEEAAASEP